MQRALLRLLKDVKSLARRYREITGRPLGVSGEIGEIEACRLLGLSHAPVRQAGFDATKRRNGRQVRYQIKTRVLLPDAKPGQRVGSIDLKKPFDKVLLVILDADLEPTSIHEASRVAVTSALTLPGSKSRNERGALGVNKFKAIGRQVWPRTRRLTKR